VLIIVLLIASLAAISGFAVSAATLSTAASGHTRQATQVHYLTDYALAAVVAELSAPRGRAYLEAARASPSEGCAGADPALPSSCFVFSREQLELAFGPMLVPASPPLPGSLGWSSTDWGVRVEMTDPMEAMPLPPGYDEAASGAVHVRPVMVTLHATGRIWAAAPGAEDIDTAAQARLSAHVVVRNVPR
jgi:hypothetical protein